MRDRPFYVNYNFSNNMGVKIMNINVSINFFDEDVHGNEVITPLGTSKMYLFNPQMVDSWDELIFEADAISGELCDIVNAMEEPYNNGHFFGPLLILDELEIEKLFRGKNLGSRVMKRMFNDMSFLNIEMIGLIPGYYGDSANDAQNKRIQKFYQQLGFEITRLQDGIPYMSRNLAAVEEY